MNDYKTEYPVEYEASSKPTQHNLYKDDKAVSRIGGIGIGALVGGIFGPVGSVVGALAGNHFGPKYLEGVAGKVTDKITEFQNKR